MNDCLHEFLNFLAKMSCGTVWTERHWREANEVLVIYEMEKGIRNPEEVFAEEPNYD